MADYRLDCSSKSKEQITDEIIKSMKVSKVKFKNKNASYSIIIGHGAIKHLKKNINLVCPGAKKSH